MASRRDQATHSRVFIGPKGAHLRWSNFARSGIGVSRGGLTHIGVRDLRRTGNVLAAETSATLRELMDRMGHSTSRAAMVYQHARTERDRAIADAIGQRITAARKSACEKSPRHHPKNLVRDT